MLYLLAHLIFAYEKERYERVLQKEPSLFRINSNPVSMHCLVGEVACKNRAVNLGLYAAGIERGGFQEKPMALLFSRHAEKSSS